MAYFINTLLIFAFLFLGFLFVCTVVFGFALLIFGRRDKEMRVSEKED